MNDEQDECPAPGELEPPLNPAPGDMPIDPPAAPLPFGPLDDDDIS